MNFVQGCASVHLTSTRHPPSPYKYKVSAGIIHKVQLSGDQRLDFSCRPEETLSQKQLQRRDFKSPQKMC